MRSLAAMLAVVREAGRFGECSKERVYDVLEGTSGSVVVTGGHQRGGWLERFSRIDVVSRWYGV